MVAPWSAPDARAREQPVVAAPVADDATAHTPKRRTPPGAPLVSHPLTRFDIVDTALDIIKAAPRVVLGVTAMFLLPTEILTTVVRRDQLDASSVNDAITTSWYVAVALRLLVVAFVTFAVAHVVWRWQLGEAPTARSAAAAALRRAPAIVAAWLVVHVCELVAGVALFVPALIVAGLLFATVPALAIEECGPLRAVARSWRLSARDTNQSVGGFLSVFVVGIGLMVSLNGVVYVSDAIFDYFGLAGAWTVQVAVGIGVWMVVVPFVAAAATLQYLDQRVRREGLDIELATARHFHVG